MLVGLSEKEEEMRQAISHCCCDAVYSMDSFCKKLGAAATFEANARLSPWATSSGLAFMECGFEYSQHMVSQAGSPIIFYSGHVYLYTAFCKYGR